MMVCWLTLQIFAASPVVKTVLLASGDWLFLFFATVLAGKSTKPQPEGRQLAAGFWSSVSPLSGKQAASSREFANSAPPVAAYEQQAHPVLPTLPNLPTAAHYTFTKIPVNTSFSHLTHLPSSGYVISIFCRSVPSRWAASSSCCLNGILIPQRAVAANDSAPLFFEIAISQTRVEETDRLTCHSRQFPRGPKSPKTALDVRPP